MILVLQAFSPCPCTCSAAQLRRTQPDSGPDGVFEILLHLCWQKNQTLPSNHRQSDLHGLLYLLVLISIPEISVENMDFNSASSSAGFQGLPLVVRAAPGKLCEHQLCHPALWERWTEEYFGFFHTFKNKLGVKVIDVITSFDFLNLLSVHCSFLSRNGAFPAAWQAEEQGCRHLCAALVLCRQEQEDVQKVGSEIHCQKSIWIWIVLKFNGYPF